MFAYNVIILLSVVSSCGTLFRESFILRSFVIVVFFALFALAACRYETGYDWLVYQQFYESLIQGDEFRIEFEPAFQLIAKMLVYLGRDYYVLQILFSVFAFLSVYKLFSFFNVSALSVYPLLYLSANFFTSQMGTIRYTAAVSVFCLGFRWLLSSNWVGYIAAVCVAMLFHSAAAFFLFAYFLLRWVGAHRFGLFMVLVSSAFLFLDRGLVLSVFPFLSGDGEVASANFVGRIFGGFIYIVIFLVCHLKRSELIGVHVSLYNSALFSLIVFFLFSWSSVISSRLVEPFFIVSTIGFYYAVRSFALLSRFLIIFGIVLYFLIKMGVLFMGGDMVVFLPYQSVIFDLGNGDGLERAHQLYNSKFK
ncbi:EpsG family protein [Metapseudomonas furukawaii]|uniref:EpsG family protein n=1 Tax=Metapseudomonas furukawaii TaxID=1149133 RepID=UPI00227BCAF3|nr:EpsG family protein [Pseudomonas furukawaii]WAG80598.1 EpsG family protein [Pseudomonas furukawaii]